jgi:hypothetical protein
MIQLTFTSFILYTVCTCCTRISACCLYRQIFIVSHQRKITQCVISATGIGYAIAIILISFFTWVPDSPVRKAIYPLTASASMISNVAFCCLPVWWIWKQEKMSKRKKLVLTVVTTWGIVWVHPLEQRFLQRYPLTQSQHYVLPTLWGCAASVGHQFRSNMGYWGDEHMDVKHHRLFVYTICAANVLI